MWDTLRERYVAVWRQLLCGWLGWPAERFDAFVAGWESGLAGEWLDGLFYHYDELYYVLGFLVPDDLAERLRLQRTGQHYNDLAALEAELGDAITGRPVSPTWGSPQYDWTAARARVEAVLARYGGSLPTPPD